MARSFNKVPKIPTNPTSSTSPRIRARTQSPKIERHPEQLWRSPKIWGGGIAALVLLLSPLIGDWYTAKLLFYYLNDSSSSGISNRKISATLCDTWSPNLKPGDTFEEIQFAERAEPTAIQKIEISTDLAQLCKVQPRSPAIGHQNGTSPISPIKRLLNSITAERSRGNNQSIVAVMWLQEAEPIPGAPAYDYNEFQRLVEQIVKNRAKIAIVGPTGQLGEMLTQRFSSTPSVYICPVSAAANCTQRVFDAARTPTK
jgi:hypothetical protein